MISVRYAFLVFLCIASIAVSAQKISDNFKKPINAGSQSGVHFLGNTEYLQTDSGIVVKTYTRVSCKSYTIFTEFIPNPTQVAPLLERTASISIHNPKLFIVHGNVSYDFFYRTKIDTPLNQQNFQQHTERVYLDILVKEKYPLKINLACRQSNSPYFKNFVDVNFNFDQYTYNRNIRQQILDKLKAQKPQYKYPDLAQAEAELKKQQQAFDKTTAWLNDPTTLQKIIEEREKIYYQKIRAREDSINAVAAGNANKKDNVMKQVI